MGKRKNTDIQRSYISLEKDNHFFRVYSSLVTSKEFNELTPAAALLYIRMGIYSNGKIEFEYPKAEYTKYLSIDGFSKAKRQLIEKGFITETRYRTTPNKYKLHFGWKTKNHFEVPQNRTEEFRKTEQLRPRGSAKQNS